MATSPFRPRNPVSAALRALLHSVRRVKIKLLSRGKVNFGKPVHFAMGSDLRPPQFLRIGQRVSFGKNFTCEANTTIGNDVLISSNVSFIARDHAFNDPNATVYTQGRIDCHEITIGNDVLIGFGATLIAPVKIGNGCIVGAGAVVTKDLPEYGVYGGVPAKFIRARYPKKG